MAMSVILRCVIFLDLWLLTTEQMDQGGSSEVDALLSSRFVGHRRTIESMVSPIDRPPSHLAADPEEHILATSPIYSSAKSDLGVGDHIGFANRPTSLRFSLSFVRLLAQTCFPSRSTNDEANKPLPFLSVPILTSRRSKDSNHDLK